MDYRPDHRAASLVCMHLSQLCTLPHRVTF